MRGFLVWLGVALFAQSGSQPALHTFGQGSGAIHIAFSCGSGTWAVPADWNSSNNKIEVIGAGGGGANPGANGLAAIASGGGGGAYSKVVNVTLSPGASIPYQAGCKGAGGPASNPWYPSGAPSVGTAGGDSWFGDFSYGSSIVAAKGGSGGTWAVNPPTAAVPGGSASLGIGTIRFSGGNSPGHTAGCEQTVGGGGAAGPNGKGGNGGAATTTCVGPGGGEAGTGGGGNGGGSDGVAINSVPVGAGSSGGNNSLGTGGGAGGSGGGPMSGANGTNGGGGGGAADGISSFPPPYPSGGNGGNGIDISSLYGSGGGGGGNVQCAQNFATATDCPKPTGNGGKYGGGGAASSSGENNPAGAAFQSSGKGGDGADGIIVITYTP